MKSEKEEAEGKVIAGGEVENRSAAATGGPKNSNQLSEIMQNCHFALNKSQKLTIEIRSDYEKQGVILSDADVRMIKKEGRLMENVKCFSQSIHYFNTLEERVGTRGMQIILLGVIWIIKAKCPMPESNARAYQVKSVNLASLQTANAQGYFLPVFSGLALFITNTGKLLTAIEKFEAKNGTGSAAAVAAAQAVVKISVDLLIAYVNDLCLADQTNALAIIESAGMLPWKQKAKNTKPDFSIKQGASGEILLSSLAGKIADKRVPTTYYWQYGLMVAGVMVWTDLPETVNRCKTTAIGMPIDTVVSFRKATRTTKGGRSVYCTPISILVK